MAEVVASALASVKPRPKPLSANVDFWERLSLQCARDDVRAMLLDDAVVTRGLKALSRYVTSPPMVAAVCGVLRACVQDVKGRSQFIEAGGFSRLEHVLRMYPTDPVVMSAAYEVVQELCADMQEPSMCTSLLDWVTPLRHALIDEATPLPRLAAAASGLASLVAGADKAGFPRAPGRPPEYAPG